MTIIIIDDFSFRRHTPAYRRVTPRDFQFLANARWKSYRKYSIWVNVVRVWCEAIWKSIFLRHFFEKLPWILTASMKRRELNLLIMRVLSCPTLLRFMTRPTFFLRIPYHCRRWMIFSSIPESLVRHPAVTWRPVRSVTRKGRLEEACPSWRIKGIFRTHYRLSWEKPFGSNDKSISLFFFIIP